MSTYGIRLPKLLQKGCVLQWGEKTRVWGWCDPGQEVQIQLQGKNGSALADAQGRFEAYLENLLPGGPFTLKLQAGTEMQEVTPVYVGDVFVCAGQSNMELPMNRVQEPVPEYVRRFSFIRLWKTQSLLRRLRTTGKGPGIPAWEKNYRMFLPFPTFSENL